MTDAAVGLGGPEHAPPGVAERLKSGMTRAAEEFARATGLMLASLPALTGELAERADDLARRIARVVGETLSGLLSVGADAPGRNSIPLVPPAAPAAPPPVVPVPVGASVLAGGTFSGVSASFSSAYEKLPQHFGVLERFPGVLARDGTRPWISREPLRPNSAPRPPNDRPG